MTILVAWKKLSLDLINGVDIKRGFIRPFLNGNRVKVDVYKIHVYKSTREADAPNEFSISC